MAYSGTGTKADPFIVDNWTDFVSVCNVDNCYIKWADSDEKVIDKVIITQSIDCGEYGFKFIDFNGWTFGEIVVDFQQHSSFNDNCIFSGQFLLNDPTICNWNIDKISFNYYDILLVENNRSTMFNCYFSEITYPEAAADSAFWTKKGQEVSLFPDSYNCTFKFVTRGRNYVIPSLRLFNCNLEIDYKSNLDTVADKNYNAIFYSGGVLSNCNVFGKIDLTQGSGSFQLKHWISNPSEPHLDVYPLYIENSIINLNIISDSISIVKDVNNHYPFEYTKSFFTTNNGNYYSVLNRIIPDEMRCFTADIKNIDFLISKGFSVKKDDNYRNNQYYNSDNINDWEWRQNPVVNNGYVFIPFWFYPLSPAPQPAEPVDENPYITVYDMETPQNGFNNHGLGILRPTQCPVVEELNGEYTINMIHPLDEEKMWQTLLEMNIVKVLGQLFVIQRVDEVQRGGSGYISVYAEHISYILNDSWIFPPFSVMGYYGQTLIDSIMAQATDMGGDWQTRYNFDITTNINAPDDFYDWQDIKDGATPYEMLLGSNGFIAKLGGELYRDNFTISIRDRMQGAQDNAFEMAIGYNLTGIKRTVDLSTFCTYFRGYDVSDGNYDTWFAVSWDPSTLPRAYPRNIVRSQNFTYDNPETAFGQLERDTMAFFNANCAPLISYELTVHDLKNNPDFKMFSNNYRYKVGDKGRVWDERLKAWITLEITKTQKNGITGECEKVIIGTQRSFTRPTGYYPIIPPMVIPSANKILEGVTPLSFYSNGDDLVDYTIFGNAGGVGKMSDNLHHGGINYGFYNPSNGQYSESTSWISSNEAIEVEPDTTYTFSLQYKPVDLLGLFVIEYDENGEYITSSYGNTSASITSYTFTTTSTTKYIRCETTGIGSYGVSDFGDFNLNEGSAQLPYEPYGCMITVIVSDGTRTQTVQITANEPLDEGESISMSESGTAIPTYEGLCSIDVVATVQPRIRITYKEG